MGLLDDAIREHLGLKRRRGADPAEIERAEREALGPVRRGPEDVEHEESGQNGLAAAKPLEYEDEGGEHWGDSFDEESELFGEEPATSFGQMPASPPPPPGPEPAADPEFATREHVDDGPELFDEDRVGPDPEPPPSSAQQPVERHPAPPRDVADLGPETAEYDVEKELHDKPDDDVLEETPEFL